MEVKGNLEEIEKVIFGEKTKNFSQEDFKNWKHNAIRQLDNIKNNLMYDKYVINDLINYLENVDIEDEDTFYVAKHKLDIAELETIYNFQYSKMHSKEEYLKMLSLDIKTKKERLKRFYEDYQNSLVYINIFDNERDLIYDIFVDGEDEQQLLDSFELLVKNRNYNYKEEYMILEMNNKYVFIMY